MPSTDIRYVFSREITIFGSYMGGSGELLRVLELFKQRKLRPVVDISMPLERAMDAQIRMEKSEHFGKIVTDRLGWDDLVGEADLRLPADGRNDAAELCDAIGDRLLHVFVLDGLATHKVSHVDLGERLRVAIPGTLPRHLDLEGAQPLLPLQ